MMLYQRKLERMGVLTIKNGLMHSPARIIRKAG